MTKYRATHAAGKQATEFTMNPTMLSLAAAIALACSMPTFAQDPGPLLEQVTVTAKKRRQEAQNVDISMSVVDSQTIRALRLRTLPDAAALMENVEVFEDFAGAGVPTWIIRGVGLQDYNTNNTPTAGVFLDGSYQVSTVMGGAGLFDIDQLEVLKGPQGGLYGRNTSGGAVVMNTHRARLGVREAYVNAGYGSWDQATLEAAYNASLTDTAALRIAGRVEDSNDGWQRSIGTGAVHGARERWDLRSWLRFEPVAGVTAEWKVQGGQDDSDIALGRSLGMYARDGSGDLCAAILAGIRDEHSCINYGGVNRLEQDAGAVPERISLQSADGAWVLSDPLNRQHNDYLSSVLDLSLQGDNMQFRSITSWDDFAYGVMLDLDGSQGEYGHRLARSDIRVLSQEFRLLSTRADPLQWLVGAAFSREEFAEHRDFNLRANTLVGLSQGVLGYDQDTTASAAFADAGYQLAEAWSINASVRYTKEDKHYRNGELYMPLTPPRYITRNLNADYALASRLSGGLSLNWTPVDATLAYLKLSRGFKSGGFYGGFPFDAAETQPYMEETINAVEVGVKQSLPEHSLQINAALFHYEYADVQGYIQAFNPITGTNIERLSNQGDARHTGMELQLHWNLLPRLELEAGLAWLNARFVSTGQLTTNLLDQQVEISGRRPYAPQWSSNLLARYHQTLAGDLALDWTLGWSYRSNFSGAHSVVAEEAVNYLPGYALVNAGLALARAGQPWSGSIWIRNALDKTYRTRVKSDGVNSYVEMFGEPRSVGVAVEYRL